MEIIWFGHSSILIRAADVTILIDPVEDEVTSVENGRTIGAISLPSDLDPHIVLITHEHWDHCQPTTVKRISKKGTRSYGPEAVMNSMAKIPSIDITTISPSDLVLHGDIEIRVLEATEGLAFMATGPISEGSSDTISVLHTGDSYLAPEMIAIGPDIILFPYYAIEDDDTLKGLTDLSNCGTTLIPIHYHHSPVAFTNHYVDPAEMKKALSPLDPLFLDRGHPMECRFLTFKDRFTSYS